jgi:hypothetical protein
MATKILLKKSSTSGSSPLTGDLDQGELAINLADRKVFTKDNGNAIVNLGGAYVDSSAPANPAEGDLYYDTTNNLLKAHDGSSFVDVGNYGDSNARLAISVSDAGGDGSMSYNNSTGVITYTGPSAAEVQAHITGGTGISVSGGAVSLDFADAGFKTDQVVEGTTNLYHTAARSVAAVEASALDMGSNSITTTGKILFANMYSSEAALPSATTYHGMFAHVHGTGKAYFAHAGNWIKLLDESSSSTTSLTEGTNLYYTDARAQAAITAGTGVAVSSGQVSIGQEVATTSNVTFADITMTGELKGPAAFTIDPAGHGNNTGAVTIKGDLIVDGTTTTVNSNEVNIGDAIIKLNADETGTPSANAGIEVERGTATNKSFIWNETDDAWDLANETLQNVILDGGSY